MHLCTERKFSALAGNLELDFELQRRISDKLEDTDKMTPDERNDDIISEQTFSKEQSKSEVLDDIDNDVDSTVSPQADSPGDSEADATTEFLLGLNFRPESEDAFEEEEDEDLENFEKSDRTVYAEQKSGSASETPSLENDIQTKQEMIAEDARVVSAGRPSPRADANSVTSSN